jgi:hypothetical protein
MTIASRTFVFYLALLTVTFSAALMDGMGLDVSVRDFVGGTGG